MMSAMSETTADAPASSASSLLQALGHPLSDRRLQVLRALGECGSISQAARQVGVSYKAAWQAIDTLSNLAGVPVVQKSVGGAGGGGARLTEAGHELLCAAQAMAQARTAVVQQLQTGAPVQRLGLQTSMRNQWPCVVLQVEIAGPLALVQVRSQYSKLHITARITAESAQLLGLQPGLPVIAMCKATAVQVMPLDTVKATAGGPDGDAERNSWEASVTRVTRGALGDEVAVQLAEGVQWGGFAPAHSRLRVASKVKVCIPDAAVVLALE